MNREWEDLRHDRTLVAVLLSTMIFILLLFGLVKLPVNGEETGEKGNPVEIRVEGKTLNADHDEKTAPGNELKPGLYVLSGNAVHKIIVVTEPLCLDCYYGVRAVPLDKILPDDVRKLLEAKHD